MDFKFTPEQEALRREFEEFFIESEHNARVEEIERLIEEENLDESKFDELYEWLMDYARLDTQGLDYSWHDMHDKFKDC